MPDNTIAVVFSKCQTQKSSVPFETELCKEIKGNLYEKKNY